MPLKLKYLNPIWIILIILLMLVVGYDGYIMLKLNDDLDRLDDMVSHMWTTTQPSVPPNRD